MRSLRCAGRNRPPERLTRILARLLVLCSVARAPRPPTVSVATLADQAARFTAASTPAGRAHAVELYESNGFVILRNAFQAETIASMRDTVMNYIARRGALVNTHAFGDRGGWYIPEFTEEPTLRQAILAPIASNAPLRTMLRRVHGSEPRVLHRSEVYVDNGAGWHFDGDVGTRAALNSLKGGACRKGAFEFPLAVDEQGRTPDGERQSITTVALYLQDHNYTVQREALTLALGSHAAVADSFADPATQGVGPLFKRVKGLPKVTLHPSLGDVVAFNQHVSHRGQERWMANKRHTIYPGFEKHRAVVSITFARDNAFSRFWDRKFAFRSSLLNGHTVCGAYHHSRRQLNVSSDCVCAAATEELAKRPLSSLLPGAATDARRRRPTMLETAATAAATPASGARDAGAPISSPIDSGTALVTGGCGAIGSEIVAGLGAAGLDVIVTARPGSENRCFEAAKRLWARRGVASARSLAVEPVDFERLPSVRAFVARVAARTKPPVGTRLRVLVNAAAVGSPSRRLTSSGLEATFQVNVLGAYATMAGLAPLLRANAPASVVNVASSAASDLDLADLQLWRRAANYSKSLAYRQSKAAMRALTNQAAAQEQERQQGTSAAVVYWNAVHPGDVGGTKMHRTRGHDTARTGAARAVWLGVHAPRLRLQGSWWQMEWHAANRTSVSEQLTRGFDEPETLRQLWRYCEKVYACLSRSQVRLTEEQARVRVHLLLRAPLGCAAAPG